MRHLEPGDDDPGTFGTERLADRLADQLRDLHDAAEHGGFDVLPLVELGARHDQRMAVRHRRDGQESHDVVVFVDEPAWQLPVDDLGEHGRHGHEHSSKLPASPQWGSSLLREA
jgi:hypothetical protein